MAIDFKPSDVVLSAALPLVACFGKAEAEQFATLLVRTMQVHGDTWRPVRWEECDLAIRGDSPDGVLGKLAANPFFRPDADPLVDGGYAERVSGASPGYALTEKGIERLRRHVRTTGDGRKGGGG